MLHTIFMEIINFSSTFFIITPPQIHMDTFFFERARIQWHESPNFTKKYIMRQIRTFCHKKLWQWCIMIINTMPYDQNLSKKSASGARSPFMNFLLEHSLGANKEQGYQNYKEEGFVYLNQLRRVTFPNKWVSKEQNSQLG